MRFVWLDILIVTLRSPGYTAGFGFVREQTPKQQVEETAEGWSSPKLRYQCLGSRGGMTKAESGIRLLLVTVIFSCCNIVRGGTKGVLGFYLRQIGEKTLGMLFNVRKEKQTPNACELCNTRDGRFD